MRRDELEGLGRAEQARRIRALSRRARRELAARLRSSDREVWKTLSGALRSFVARWRQALEQIEAAEDPDPSLSLALRDMSLATMESFRSQLSCRGPSFPRRGTRRPLREARALSRRSDALPGVAEMLAVRKVLEE